MTFPAWGLLETGQIKAYHDKGLEIRWGGSGGFPFAESQPLLSLILGNVFLSSTLGYNSNEWKQLSEQGHPAASQDDDITVSSCPGKTQGSNNRERAGHLYGKLTDGCRPPANIRPGSVAKNYPGATPASAQFARAALQPSHAQSNRISPMRFFLPIS